MNPSTEENIFVEQNSMIPGQDHWLNLVGFIMTLDIVPTYIPRGISQQFVIVTNGGSSLAYIYDTKGRSWKYTTLT